MTTVFHAGRTHTSYSKNKVALRLPIKGRYLLVLPASLVVFVLLIAPFLWLAMLSFLDQNGQFTLENYVNIANAPSVLRVFSTTLQISLSVTIICGVLGYIIAFMLSVLPARLASIGLLLVIIPFWTSILVRTYAWMVLLARKGGINTWLLKVNLIQEPVALMYNWTGTIIGMVHIMLPFLVLPLYSSMQNINPNLLRAAAGMGAKPAKVFWRIFFPLSLPGFLSGFCFIFVLCLGFFITPVLLGGGRVIMMAQLIEKTAVMNANWGPASALGVTLVAISLGLLALGWLIGKGWSKR